MSDASFLPEDHFRIEVGKVVMHCERLKIGSTDTYRIVFSSARDPLVITRAKAEDGSWFWTSIPEGRQKEATGMGKILEEHFSKM